MKRQSLALTAVFFVLAACGGKEQPAVRTGDAARTAPADPSYVKKDTYFRLPNAAGGELDLASYSGKPVLVMFFTETCPYCRKAAPFIQQVSASYSAKGLATAGILVQDSAQPALNFAADFGITFPIAYKGKDVSRKYRTQGVPYIYLLNKDHEIYDVWEGYDHEYDAPILKAVETVLAKK